MFYPKFRSMQQYAVVMLIMAIINVNLPASAVEEQASQHYPIVFSADRSQGGMGGLVTKDESRSGEVITHLKQDATFSSITSAIPVLNAAIILNWRLTCALRAFSQGMGAEIYEEIRAGFENFRRPELEAINFEQFGQIIRTLWDAYEVPGTQFSLWIPKQDAVPLPERIPFEKVFLLEKLNKLSFDDDNAWRQHCPDQRVSKNDPRLTLNEYTKSDLQKIFRPKDDQPENSILDVVINGHGGPKHVGSIPVNEVTPEPKRITSLLSYLNTEATTGIVYIISCSAGGRNLDLIRKTSKHDPSREMPLDYDYILIVGSIADSPIASFPATGLMLKEYFSTAKSVEKRGMSLQGLLARLAQKNPLAPVRGYAAFPHVLLPHTTNFRTFDVEENVRIVGSVLVHTHEQERKALIIKESQVTLWYAEKVDVPVEVHTAQSTLQSKSDLFERMTLTDRGLGPIANELLLVTGMLGFPEGLPEFDELKPFNVYQAPAGRSYPLFIPMKGKDDQKYIQFKKIICLDSEDGYAGVMQFIRDAFANLSGRTDKKTILIDSLSGKNDIGIYFARLFLLARWKQWTLKSDMKKQKLYSQMYPTVQNLMFTAEENPKKIKLKDVVISLSPYPGKMEIKFTLGENRYIYSISGAPYMYTRDRAQDLFPWSLTQRQATLPPHQREHAQQLPGITLPAPLEQILRQKARGKVPTRVLESHRKWQEQEKN